MENFRTDGFILFIMHDVACSVSPLGDCIFKCLLWSKTALFVFLTKLDSLLLQCIIMVLHQSFFLHLDKEKVEESGS